MKLLYTVGIPVVGFATFYVLLRLDISEIGKPYDVGDTGALLFISFVAGMLWPATIVGLVGYQLLRKLTAAINAKTNDETDACSKCGHERSLHDAATGSCDWKSDRFEDDDCACINSSYAVADDGGGGA